MKLWWAFIILLCVAAEPVALTPAERAQFAAEQMAEVATFGKGLPTEPPRELRDVIDFEWINNRLLPKTSLAGSFRARQPLIDDTARAIVQRAPLGNRRDDSIYHFQLQFKRFNPDTLEVESIDISRLGTGMFMSLYITGVDESTHIQITDPQSLNPLAKPNPVRMYHQVTPRPPFDDEVSPPIWFEAPTLLDMIRTQREEAVPVLRRLFNAMRRPDIIGRALNPLWIRAVKPWITPPQSIIDRVTKLVRQLDADDYGERQKTFQALSNMGEDARLVLINLDQSTLSAEQRSSISALLEPVGEVDQVELDELENSAIELVDGLYAPNPIVREAIRLRIESLTKLKLEVDTRIEPSIEVVEAIRAKIENLNAP